MTFTLGVQGVAQHLQRQENRSISFCFLLVPTLVINLQKYLWEVLRDESAQGLLPTLNEYNGAIKDTALLQSPADKNLTLGDIPGQGRVASPTKMGVGWPHPHLGNRPFWGAQLELMGLCSHQRGGKRYWKYWCEVENILLWEGCKDVWAG